jgi:hypothetical protein
VHQNERNGFEEIAHCGVEFQNEQAEQVDELDGVELDGVEQNVQRFHAIAVSNHHVDLYPLKKQLQNQPLRQLGCHKATVHGSDRVPFDVEHSIFLTCLDFVRR